MPLSDILHDALMLGAGPTGLSCGIELKRLGLRPLLIDQGCVVAGAHTSEISIENGRRHGKIIAETAAGRCRDGADA